MAAAGRTTSHTAAQIDESLIGRRVLVGVCGGIAAYKTAAVVSRLVQGGADVTVLMTPAATHFVGPLTFEALSGRAVYTDPWSQVESHDPQHIALARETAVMLIAPCSMNMLARLANGQADDVVSLVCSAIDRTQQRVLIAPSMNEVMLNQPATQRNLAVLREDGFVVIEPEIGWQACRAVGPGRMPEPESLVSLITEQLAAVNLPC
jgi:phosphopantothenoylcysteine synthetase/decarboxylase